MSNLSDIFSSPIGGPHVDDPRVAHADETLDVLLAVSVARQQGYAAVWKNLDKTNVNFFEQIVSAGNAFNHEHDVQQAISAYSNAVRNFELNLPYSPNANFPTPPTILLDYAKALSISF